MNGIQFRTLQPADDELIQLIANWYLSEWNIPAVVTIEKIKTLQYGSAQLQALLTIDGQPVATGGLYNQVALVQREPRFGVYKHWLALVFTEPQHRNKGYGALLCNYIQEEARALGLQQICLFTHSAESLYRRLGWEALERVDAGGKNVVVMKLKLSQ
jgi:GNAT superfamily N-acetyltransferase